MNVQFPMTLHLSPDEARIVLKALSLYNPQNVTAWPAMLYPSEQERQDHLFEHAARMVKELGDHIEHYEQLESESDGPGLLQHQLE